ncbi:DUF2236 domain-containing protein [Mycena sanguinolenta]|uniref:DUF2236 domain-containing protein n=1 Tax=Mycena sanguinolenta TaxID=230812 RepID=A0A8H6XLD9_9AGAR|nr:DUF2236 domain-containing protein [Mycena sanguinolenta]
MATRSSWLRFQSLELESTGDARDYIPSVFLFVLASPLCLALFTYPFCLVALGIYWAVPVVVRLRWPTFMKARIAEDPINGGALMNLLGSFTAFLLQYHNPTISIAMNIHSDIRSAPLARLLHTFLYLEMVHHGSSQEKEQTASWLRWMHRHVHGSINEEMRKELGIRDQVDQYGYTNDLKENSLSCSLFSHQPTMIPDQAYVLETLIWMTISFQERFGKPYGDFELLR